METYHQNELKNTNNVGQTMLESVYKQHYERLILYAERVLSNNFYVHDVVHDVFLNMHQQQNLFVSQHVMSNYIYRAVYNRCIDILRKAQTMQKYEEIYVDENRGKRESLFHDILYQELSDLIDYKIEKLPSRCKLIFKLKFCMEFTNPEISKNLGISVKTVENQVFNARNVLKDYLKEYRCS